MSAPNASSSSSQLVSYAQDVNYTRMEGFKRFKNRYNVKNACCACNDPRGTYPSAETVYQAVKGPGCTLRSFNGLSLAPYYAAQMRRCTQKWDRRDDQGPNSETIDMCRQLVGIVGTGLYHSMANVQSVVRSNCGFVSAFQLIDLLVR